MGVAAGLTMIEIPQDSIINLLIMGAPPLLLFGAFGMRDTPSLEIPPLPRRPKVDAWQLAPASAGRSRHWRRRPPSAVRTSTGTRHCPPPQRSVMRNVQQSR